MSHAAVVGFVVLALVWGSIHGDDTTHSSSTARESEGKYGDKCESNEDCSALVNGVCDLEKKQCFCDREFQVTNHIDKCGKRSKVNDTCFFNEQCSEVSFETTCQNDKCVCILEQQPVIKPDGSFDCVAPETPAPNRNVDPTMIGVLVGLGLMFVILCVVLRLFSKARWRENRSIFNTPNPRLMNVSLLRDSKLLHSAGSRAGSRRGSRASNVSQASGKSASPKPSPTKPVANSNKPGSSENVTIELQNEKV